MFKRIKTLFGQPQNDTDEVSIIQEDGLAENIAELETEQQQQTPPLSETEDIVLAEDENSSGDDMLEPQKKHGSGTHEIPLQPDEYSIRE